MEAIEKPTITRHRTAPESFGPAGGDGHPALQWLGEDSEFAVAYGHIAPEVMVSAVLANTGDSADDNDAYDPAAVRHVHAVSVRTHYSDSKDDEGWGLQWVGVKPEDEHAFPATLLQFDV